MLLIIVFFESNSIHWYIQTKNVEECYARVYLGEGGRKIEDYSQQ